MDLGKLWRNLWSARTALDVWKVVRAEVAGFEWRKANGSFERVTVLVPLAEADTVLSFELARPIEWLWTPDHKGEIPEWPAAYTVRDARAVGQEVMEAMLATLAPPNLMEVMLAAVAPPTLEDAAPALALPNEEPQPYDRPEITPAHQAEASRLAVQLTNGKSMKDVRLALVGLLCENQRLTLECNDHRAARGLEALHMFETATNGRHG